MPRFRLRRYQVPCPFSHEWLHPDYVSRWRPDMFICPTCHGHIHRRVDGRAPAHLRIVLK